MSKKIPGGFYLISRKIQESKIKIAPPACRELWDWLIREANQKDKVSSGRLIKRGQCIVTYEDIRNGLKWKIGYRYEYYSKNKIQTALNFLRRENMISTNKTEQGQIITIINYNKYQDIRNYERNNFK